MRSKMNSNQGVSIVESIIAAAILAAIIVGLFGVLSQGSNINKDMLLRQRAYSELSKVLESPDFAPAAYTRYPNKDTSFSLSSVIIDDQGSGPDITAIPRVDIFWVFYRGGPNPWTITSIPAKKIKISLPYKTTEGKKDTCRLETLLTLQ